MFMLSPINISIHLMLLFIKEIRTLDSPPRLFQYISCYCLSSLVIIWFLVPPSFQYISCYCLSISKSFYNCFLTISIHLMLLFICSGNCSSETAQAISIHLMLLFIGHNLSTAATLRDFNTSHVTVYPSYDNVVQSDVLYFNTSHVTVYPFRL